MENIIPREMSDDLKEPIAVLGIGVEGRETIHHLLRRGYRDITALDRSNVEGLPDAVKTVFGPDHDQMLDRFPTIFRTPSIRPDHPSLVSAAGMGSRITSAISHFILAAPCPTVGITGTVGKGTVASLVASMLSRSGKETRLGGNIGENPLSFLDTLTPAGRAVLEISSFQAMDLEASPNVAVFLKTTSEHLDWHVDIEEYVDAKAHLIAHQSEGDTIVYDADSKVASEIANRGHGVKLSYSLVDRVEHGITLQGDKLLLMNGSDSTVLPIDLGNIKLKGRFNLENIAASILATIAMGGDIDAACRAAEEFEPLPHRLEVAARSGAVTFVNDSYATRPEATIGAVSSFGDEPLALILGGSEKYADFEMLAGALLECPNIVSVSLIGATARRLAKTIDQAGERSFRMIAHDTLEAAAEGAVAALGDKGVVLLSPACASFGLFANYKVRGECFRKKAKELAHRLSTEKD